ETPPQPALSLVLAMRFTTLCLGLGSAFWGFVTWTPGLEGFSSQPELLSEQEERFPLRDAEEKVCLGAASPYDQASEADEVCSSGWAWCARWEWCSKVLGTLWPVLTGAQCLLDLALLLRLVLRFVRRQPQVSDSDSHEPSRPSR
ncbi:unnamed protein product, partial [Effrenium voratum]